MLLCARGTARGAHIARRLPLGLALLALTAGAAAGPPPDSAPQAQEVFATVGDSVITVPEYIAAMRAAMQQKYYHGHPPEAELAKFQREVADSLVNRLLLLHEARRRGLKPDPTRVQASVQRYEERYRDSPEWQKNRAQILPGLRQRLEEDDLLRQLDEAVGRAQEPGEQQLRAYYQAHPDKFTEPEQVRVSIILLKVDPSSPNAVWDQARAEAARLVQRLSKGAEFSELARVHSADASAQNGGDLGYLHKGMLGGPAQEAVDKLKAGELSAPVTLLEGVAIFRLNARKPARLNPFAKVQGRVRQLWINEERARAHEALVARLRAGTKVQIKEQYLLPVGGKGK